MTTTATAATVRAPVPTAPSSLLISGRSFVDSDSSRAVLLRGVNLSGNAKLPTTPLTPTHVSDGFLDDDTNISFVGRPFPLDQADVHLRRLKSWGFNFLRLLFTWEALEHKGPGVYDYEYMDYLIEVLHKLREHGFKCFLDPHQDAWSRFSGGSGAPGWTLRAAGLNAANFAATNAAIVHNTFSNPNDYPKMVWSTNYFKLAAGTMFTLFFAGLAYAPNCLVAVPESADAAASYTPGNPPPKPKLVHIQEFLQSHFINAVAELAKRIHEKAPELEDTVVVGYDTLNEPNVAFIGAPDANKRPPQQELLLDLAPTMLQSMLLGEGHSQVVEKYGMSWMGPYFISKESVDPAGVSAWFPRRLPSHLGYPKEWDEYPEWVQEGGCIWANHGVWDRQTKELLVPDYFVRFGGRNGKPPNFDEMFLSFAERFIRAVRAHHKSAIAFVEPAGGAVAPRIRRPWLEKRVRPKWLEGVDVRAGVPVTNDGSWDRICYAPHFYDGITLITKNFNPYFTPDLFGAARKKYPHVFLSVKFFESGIKACFRDQLAGYQDEGVRNMGETPCLIGEIGVPMDLEGAKAYKTGDYSAQTKALDANMSGLETNPGLNFTLWTYVPDNTNEWGDGWNSEDLSIWSPPLDKGLQEKDLNAGARGIKAFVRPAPVLVPGTIVFTSFDLATATFTFIFRHPSVQSLARRTNGTATAQQPAPFAFGWDRAAASPPSESAAVVPLGSCPHDVEIFLPRLHFPDLDSLRVHASSVPRDPRDLDDLAGVAGLAETASRKIDLEHQRLWYRCPCARRHVAETPVGGGAGESGRTGKDDGVDEVEHRLVVRYGVVPDGKTLEVVARENAEKAAAVARARSGTGKGGSLLVGKK